MGILSVGGREVELANVGRNVCLGSSVRGICCFGHGFVVCLFVLLIALHIFVELVSGDTCLPSYEIVSPPVFEIKAMSPLVEENT